MNKINNYHKISRCLISVSNKTGIIELAKFLHENSVEIISTGGTYNLLKSNNIPAIEISKFTNFQEMMDGRLKTLHHKVHGGLLGIVDNISHQQDMTNNNILPIDLLVVNLYPFVETVAKKLPQDEIIENIDIGGPAMVRSASKNFASKTVITSPNQYENLIEELKNNQIQTTFEFRKKLASQAFHEIAKYDMAIANWFNPENFYVASKLKQKLRYGENSHQNAELYEVEDKNFGIVNANQIQGKELSYNNLNDADSAYNLILEFNKPSCAIIKHANPCGVASADNIYDAYKTALQSDPKSAFGGIVALNHEIDAKLANEMISMFYEVIIAPKISAEAQEIFTTKKNLRILIADFNQYYNRQIKSISGGFLVQDFDNLTINNSSLTQVSKIGVSSEEISQLLFAMKICKHVKSNAIVVVNNMQTVGIGVGQTSRIDACEIACNKGANFIINDQKINKAKGAFLASDAFFPFADNIEVANKYGIKAIIAPSGSLRDQEVIAKADACGIALYFISSRHFKH